MRAEDRHLARRQFFFDCMRAPLDASTAAEAFSLGSTTGPSTVEALESTGGNTGNADNYLAPSNRCRLKTVCGKCGKCGNSPKVCVRA
jgi:hypothetical protein